MIPCESAEPIPIGLAKWMSTPIAIIANICYACYSRECMLVKRSINDFGDSRVLALCESVFVEAFLEQCWKKNKMCAEPKIFLGNLELHHERSLWHCAKERMKRLAWLEIDWSVLYLDEYVRPETSIERFE